MRGTRSLFGRCGLFDQRFDQVTDIRLLVPRQEAIVFVLLSNLAIAVDENQDGNVGRLEDGVLQILIHLVTKRISHRERGLKLCDEVWNQLPGISGLTAPFGWHVRTANLWRP